MDATTSKVTFERVDELPILLHGLQQLQLAEIIDAALPPSHGDRRGLSYGQLSVLLVAFIMSQCEHHLCAVEDWVNTHRLTLSGITGWEFGEKDATDDRLGALALVEVLGQHEAARFEMEQQLGGQMIRGYGLPTEIGRCDSSSFSVYHQVEAEKEEGRLLRFGHSKDRRPDLCQYRQVLGTLDPAGVPLVRATVPGNGADDPIYVPAWKQMAQTIGHKDFIAQRLCGWRIFATNAPHTRLERSQAVGNPKRTTQRPSTESLLRAFAGIILGRLPAGDFYTTPLTPLQTQILILMGIPPNLYPLPNPPSASLTAA